MDETRAIAAIYITGTQSQDQAENDSHDRMSFSPLDLTSVTPSGVSEATPLTQEGDLEAAYFSTSTSPQENMSLRSPVRAHYPVLTSKGQPSSFSPCFSKAHAIAIFEPLRCEELDGINAPDVEWPLVPSGQGDGKSRSVDNGGHVDLCLREAYLSQYFKENLGSWVSS
jgi:hypothetical protein